MISDRCWTHYSAIKLLHDIFIDFLDPFVFKEGVEKFAILESFC